MLAPLVEDVQHLKLTQPIHHENAPSARMS